MTGFICFCWALKNTRVDCIQSVPENEKTCRHPDLYRFRISSIALNKAGEVVGKSGSTHKNRCSTKQKKTVNLLITGFKLYWSASNL